MSRFCAADDAMGRAGSYWTTVAMTLPDDGAGALSLLCGITLNDDRSSTYKLGLLPVVAEVANLTPPIPWL